MENLKLLLKITGITWPIVLPIVIWGFSVWAALAGNVTLALFAATSLVLLMIFAVYMVIDLIIDFFDRDDNR